MSLSEAEQSQLAQTDCISFTLVTKSNVTMKNHLDCFLFLRISLCFLVLLDIPVTSVHVIVDVDAGSDDAIAVMLALHATKDKGKMVESLSITSVAGNTGIDNVTRNVLITLHKYGVRNIRPHKGAEQPLFGDGQTNHWFGDDGLGNSAHWFLPTIGHVENLPAVEAIIAKVRKHPKQVVFLALGPLTNLAMAYKRDPEVLDLLKELHILGGTTEFDAWGTRNVVNLCEEFNFHFDQAAAELVLAAATCPVFLVVADEDLHNSFPWVLYESLASLPTERGRFFNLTTAFVATNPNVSRNELPIFDINLVASYFYPNTISTSTFGNKTLKLCHSHSSLLKEFTTVLDFDMKTITSLLHQVLR